MIEGVNIMISGQKFIVRLFSIVNRHFERSERGTSERSREIPLKFLGDLDSDGIPACRQAGLDSF